MTVGTGVPFAPGVAGLESEATVSGFKTGGAAVGVETGETLRSLTGVSSLTSGGLELGERMARSRSGETLSLTILVSLAAEDLRGLSLAEAAALGFDGGMARMMVGDDFWSRSSGVGWLFGQWEEKRSR